MRRADLNPPMNGRLKSALRKVLALGVFAVAGCAGWQPPPPAAAERREKPAEVSLYLTELKELRDGDPAVKAEIFERARTAFERAPTTTHRLKLALLLALPGHPSSDAVEAQRMLTDLLAVPESLLPDERALAAIQLLDIEQRLMLQAENQQLAAAMAEASSRHDVESERRLEKALEENRRLRGALEEAEAKLEAVTSIERSIRERDENDETSP